MTSLSCATIVTFAAHSMMASARSRTSLAQVSSRPMSSNVMPFGSPLFYARDEGASISELARRLGVSRQRVYALLD
jgi:hypothetical protein